MKKWEYLEVRFNDNELRCTEEIRAYSIQGEKTLVVKGRGIKKTATRPRLREVLADMGEQGWELVGFGVSPAMMKRPKLDNE